jgi:hypothetical protein
MSKKQEKVNETLKRFNLLMEYDFYISDSEEEEVVELGDELITEEPPEGEAPEGEEPPVDGEAPVDGEEGLEDEIPDGEVGDEASFGEELPEPEAMEEPLPEPEAMEEPMAEPEPMEDEVELDVTELVQGTEAARQSADHANQQIGDLLAKFDNLTQSLDKMDAINSKIDDIEHEIEVRNPTPEEQLEMRSLDSFPYNLKLTDYWSEKEGNYDAMKNKEDSNEEFVLTQEEVDQDYNSIHIKDSFSPGKDDKEMRY